MAHSGMERRLETCSPCRVRRPRCRRLDLYTLVLALTVGCGGERAADSFVEVDASADSPTDGNGASDTAPALDGNAEATTDGAPCIPWLGSCQGDLLCCDGTQCSYDGCGIDPGCAWPGQACDGTGIQCCEGTACGADGKCPDVACHDVGQLCGIPGGPACCAGLTCHNDACIDPSACSLAGASCGNGCCAGLSCTPAGECEGTVTCGSGYSGCLGCVESQCCSQLAQCESTYLCADTLPCIEQCLASGGALAQCVPYCGANGELVDSLTSCATNKCAPSCDTP